MLESLIDQLKNKTILITGGTGFFGKVLKEHFLKLSEEHKLNSKLILTARNPIVDNRVTFVTSDVRNKLIIKDDIDYIIHAATPVANDNSEANELLEIIVNGTQSILQLAKEKKVKKFINISSGAVYGKQPSEVEKVPEEFIENVALFDRHNIYGSGKRIAENLVENFCRKNEIDFLTLRCFAFSGKHLPLDAQFAIGNFVRDAKEFGKITVKGDGSAIRSYLDSTDLAEWLVSALLSEVKNQTYNLGSDEEISIKDLASLVADLVPGTTVEIQNTQTVGIKSNRYVPSVDRIKKEIKVVQKTNLKQSILKMLH